MGKKIKSSKRKSAETESTKDIAFSSEALKSHGDKNGSDVIDDLNEPTMGEKLAGLNLAENGELDIVDSTPQAKPPSADSVFILLKQAIRADDRALLINCLFRQDKKVISNSLALLNPSDVMKLLQSLLSIIQLRGAVLACALPWLRSLLLQHASSIMSQESSLSALNSLYQIIESRASTFNQHLQLSSSLDLLYAETIDDAEVEEENNVAIPAIYEDNDDSDDEESEDDAMDTESIQDEAEPQIYSDISEDE